jgi:hypothetical protein
MTLYGLQSRLLTSGLQPYIERTEDKKIKETTFGTTSDGRRVAKKRERWSPLTASLLVGTLELDRKKKKGH